MNVAQRASVLPPSLAPIGINREQAAAFIGISPTMYDKAVEAGTMPGPRVLGGRLVYDVQELVDAFRRLPHKDGRANVLASLDEYDGKANPWD